MIVRVRSIAALACGLALVLACSHGPAHEEKSVRVALYNNPGSLSLIGNTDASSGQIVALITDSLVAYDAQSHYVPMVAKSWDLSPDGTAITLHLREGVLWHDGQPVTSRDVAFTAKKVMEPATQARTWISAFSIVASIETPDDRTVIVKYKHPYADALEMWRVPLIPEHVAAKDAKFLEGDFARHPIGCGPFRFVSYEPGQSVVLEAFDRYWGGRPAIDGVVFKILSTERTAYETLLLGGIDILAVTPDVWRESQTAARASRLSHFVFYPLRGWRVDWNQESAPFFKDKRVRRALLLALDRARFSDTATAGFARPCASSFPPESLWADPSVVAIPYDPAESGRLLDETGWRRPAGGGLRRKDGRTFSFTLLLYSGPQDLAERMAVWMQQSLAEAGIEMKIEKLAWAAFQERRKTHQFEAAMGSVSFDATPDRYDLYHSSAREGGLNYGGFNDPEVDRLLEDTRQTIDEAARRDVCNRLQHRLDDLQPIAFLFQLASPVLHDPDLQGIVPSAIGLYQFSPGPRAWHWAGDRARP